MWLFSGIELAMKKKELELENKEMGLALREEKLKAEYARQRMEIYAEGNKQVNEFEHKWHSGVADRNAELKELDAYIKARKESIDLQKDMYERIIKEKDNTISALTEALGKMAPVLKTALSISNE